MADAQKLADIVWDLLDGIAQVNAYDGEFVDANGQPVDPPKDDDGRVHAYAVFYPSPGWAHSILLCADLDSLDWSFQVTCTGGDRARALRCIQRVRDALSDTWITDPDSGQELQINEAGNPGSLRRDDNVSPARFYLPLQFTLNA